MARRMMVSDFFPALDFTVRGYVLETPMRLTLPSPETKWDGGPLLPPLIKLHHCLRFSGGEHRL